MWQARGRLRSQLSRLFQVAAPQSPGRLQAEPDSLGPLARAGGQRLPLALSRRVTPRRCRPGQSQVSVQALSSLELSLTEQRGTGVAAHRLEHYEQLPGVFPTALGAQPRQQSLTQQRMAETLTAPQAQPLEPEPHLGLERGEGHGGHLLSHERGPLEIVFVE